MGAFGLWHQVQQPVQHLVGALTSSVQSEQRGVDGCPLKHADDELEEPTVDFTVRHQQRDDEIGIGEGRGRLPLGHRSAHGPQVPPHVGLFDQPVFQPSSAGEPLQPLPKERTMPGWR